jgi:hypothetical protein
MSKAVLGDWVDGGPAKLDLPRLVETRMLIQASSGQGKSRALRRLLEVTAGKVQQLVVDPEGEFQSLREKHDLVICAARGADAIAHPRAAALLARRLLETEASAVLDISELKASERHTFTRLFLESLVEAPKSLRHSVLLALDEAQIFCPEKGQGESEASGVVIDIATRGRKRGLCLVAATQRISMFHKAAAAELKNRLIGGTSLDVDVKRAAFDLGMPQAEARDLLRALEPGHFFAFGPAFAQLEPRELVTGDVETTHPKVGHRQWTAPPKPTAAILALLPKLADLPKEAETEARSLEDLRRELVTTRRELTQVKRSPPAAPVVKAGPDPAAERRHAAQLGRLTGLIEELMNFIVTINAKDFTGKVGESMDPAAITRAIEAAVNQARNLMEAGMEARNRELLAMQLQAGQLAARAKKLLEVKDVHINVQVKHNEPFTVTPPPRAARASTPSASIDQSGMPPVQAKILNALAEAEQLSADAPDRSLVAILSGYTHIQSTGFVKALGALSTAGMITYPPGGRVALTDAGRAVAVGPEAPTTAEELQERVSKLIGGAASKVLKPLIDANREPMSRQELAEASGYGHIQSTGFVKTLGRLRTLGFIDYPSSGMVVAQPVLFLE